MSASGCLVKRLDDSEDLANLKHLFLSSLGPKGGIKVFVNSVGHLSFSTVSSRIISWLDLSDPCAYAIAQNLRSFHGRHQDGGSILVVLMSSLTLILRQFPLSRTRDEDLLVLHGLVTDVLRKSKVRLNLESTTDLIHVVKSVLSSKHWLLNSKLLDKLCHDLIRAFISVLPDNEDTSEAPSIEIQVMHSMKDSSSILCGCLYGIGAEEAEDGHKSEIQVLALNLQLVEAENLAEETHDFQFDIVGDLTASGTISNFMKNLLTFCLANQINLIVNQKQVSAEFRAQFRKLGITVLERFGKKRIHSFRKVSGCSIISTLSPSPQLLKNSLGTLKSLKYVKVNEKDFIHFQGQNIKVATVVISHWNEEICDEIEILANAAVAALFQILRDPTAYPGSGCLESILISHILQKINLDMNQKCTNFFHKCLGMFGDVLAAIHNDTANDLIIDCKYGHLWRLRPEQDSQVEPFCRCGLLTAVNDLNGVNWMALASAIQSQSVTGCDNEIQFVNCTNNHSKSLILDSVEMKCDQYSTLFEITNSLSAIEYAVNVD